MMLWINIARLTWLELWQSRTYKTLLVFAAFSPVMAVTIASLFMVDIGKVYLDGMAAIAQLLAMVFLVFLVVTLLSRDIFEKVCYILLVPPVSRTHYYAGRFSGVMVAFFLLMLVLLLSGIMAGQWYVEAKEEFYQSGYSMWIIMQLLFFNYFQYVSILGVIFFIISWSSGDAETMLFTVAVLVFTWVFPPVLKAMQNPDVSTDTPIFITTLLQWIYEVIPHLQGSEIGLQLAHGVMVPAELTLFYMLEHLSYATIFFLLGLILFKRRNL